MRYTNPARPITLVVAIIAASAPGLALAGPEPIPTRVAKQAQDAKNQPEAPADSQPTSDATTDDAAQPGAEEAPAGAESQAAPSYSSGAFIIARWMRSIGGRIHTGPKIDSRTRVSLPNPTDAAQGWRVSIPSYASARVSAPPKRSHQPDPVEQAPEAAAEQVASAATETVGTPE